MRYFCCVKYLEPYVLPSTSGSYDSRQAGVWQSDEILKILNSLQIALLLPIHFSWFFGVKYIYCGVCYEGIYKLDALFHVDP